MPSVGAPRYVPTDSYARSPGAAWELDSAGALSNSGESRPGSIGPLRNPSRSSQIVARAAHPQTAPIRHVRIDHRRPQVGVAHQLLHRPDVGAGFEQVGREGVAERMTGRALRDTGCRHRGPERSLHHGLVEMMALPTSVWRDEAPRRHEQVLPAPIEVDIGKLAAQGIADSGGADPVAAVGRDPRSGTREELPQG